jgi:hypothetical protein
MSWFRYGEVWHQNIRAIAIILGKFIIFPRPQGACTDNRGYGISAFFCRSFIIGSGAQGKRRNFVPLGSSEGI